MVGQIGLIDSIGMVVMCMLMLYTGLLVGRGQLEDQIKKEARGEKLDWFDRFMTKQANWFFRKV